MTEGVANEPKSLGSVGDFRILQDAPERFRLERLEEAATEFADVENLVFQSHAEVRDVGDLLSKIFKGDTSTGNIGTNIGDIGRAEVVGGEHGSCKLFRKNMKTGRIGKKPFLKAESRQELIEGLSALLENRQEASGA